MQQIFSLVAQVVCLMLVLKIITCVPTLPAIDDHDVPRAQLKRGKKSNV